MYLNVGSMHASAMTNNPAVTMKGKPVVLLGTPVEAGAPAPDFRVVDVSADDAIETVPERRVRRGVLEALDVAARIRNRVLDPGGERPVAEAEAATHRLHAAPGPEEHVVHALAEVLEGAGELHVL